MRLQVPEEKTHRVRLAAGSGLRSDVWRQFVQRFGRIKIREGYGLTEASIGFLNYTDEVGPIGRASYFNKVSRSVSFPPDMDLATLYSIGFSNLNIKCYVVNISPLEQVVQRFTQTSDYAVGTTVVEESTHLIFCPAVFTKSPSPTCSV